MSTAWAIVSICGITPTVYTIVKVFPAPPHAPRMASDPHRLGTVFELDNGQRVIFTDMSGRAEEQAEDDPPPPYQEKAK